MNGLRVYTNTQSQETQGGYTIFYCRRDDGPYYRWSYEEQRKQWRVARVRPSHPFPSALFSTNWKNVPAVLRPSMVAHYQGYRPVKQRGEPPPPQHTRPPYALDNTI